MVTYRVMFLVGITGWYGGAYTADPVRVSLDDGCSLTFLIRNNSKVDVEVWVSREMHYKRPDNTIFTTVARSARTFVGSGKNGTMVFYAPDCWVQNKLSKQKFVQWHNESDLHVYDLTYSFGGCVVQHGTKVAIILDCDGKTLTLEPLSGGSKHNSCTE